MSFRTRDSGDLVTSQQANDSIEMSFPAGIPQAIPEDVKPGIVEVTRKVLGLDTAPRVLFVGDAPGPSFKGYVIVHIDDGIDLEKAEVSAALVVRSSSSLSILDER